MFGRLNTKDRLLRLNIINVDKSFSHFAIQRWKLLITSSSHAISHGRYGVHVYYGGDYYGVVQTNLENAWMPGWESNGLVFSGLYGMKET